MVIESLAPCGKAKIPLLYRNYEALEKLRGQDAHALIKEIQSINSYQCSLPGYMSARGLDSSRRGPKDGRLKSGCRRWLRGCQASNQKTKSKNIKMTILICCSVCSSRGLLHRSCLSILYT